MKKKGRKARVPAELKQTKPKFVSMQSRIIILLEQRNDLSNKGVAEVLGLTIKQVSQCTTSLRKKGFLICPKRQGSNQPLIISNNTASGAARFIQHRRNLYLPTATRMIVNEVELGEHYAQLNEKPVELLELLNESTKNETPIDFNK